MMSQRNLKEKVSGQFELGKPAQVSIPEEGRRILANLAPLQRYPPAIELFKQGGPAQDIYIVEHGLVKLVRLSSQGRDLIVGLRSPGWVVGIASVILQKPYPASALSLTYCHLRRIPAAILIELLQSNIQLSWYFHLLQSREIFDQIGHQVGLGFLSARQRLEQLLWRLIYAQKLSSPQKDELKKEARLNLPLKNNEIADLIAVTPEHLSRVMRQMQQEGVLRREKGWIIIIDPQQLQHASDLL